MITRVSTLKTKMVLLNFIWVLLFEPEACSLLHKMGITEPSPVRTEHRAEHPPGEPRENEDEELHML